MKDNNRPDNYYACENAHLAGDRIIGKQSMKRTAGVKRAQELVKVAGESIGRQIGLVAAEASLQNLLDEHELYVKHTGRS